MSINNDLKRAAEAVLAMDYPCEHTVCDGRLGKTSTEYARLAHPLSVRALIVENERLEAINNQMILLECNGGTAQAAINLLAERDRLRAEVAGLRTGYEAYEQVNAELKAENERLHKALESCADELLAEIICKHGSQKLEDMHPVTRRLYERDVAPVIEARAALGRGEQS